LDLKYRSKYLPFLLLGFLLSFIILPSCQNPAVIDQVELHDLSTLNENSQTNTKEIEQIYKYKCSICHGKQGVSVIIGAPDLVSSKLSFEERVAIILSGRGTMPPQKDVLDMPTIRGLAVFIDRFE
jgi:mono/diheme cytochrome c family protein